MSCWRVLQLPDVGTDEVPQLLFKPVFTSKAYTLFLTDLSNIWSEELDLAAILKRATQQKSPIEVSKEDTSQLGILLEHVEKSLSGDHESSCVLTRSDSEGIVIHTTATLPGPLGTLRWEFDLEKRSPAVLKNELILPLLVSSHIQHERVNNLLATIQEKDRAITRFVDQFESSNLDLALAFPSIAGMKSGRRIIKREQAARHIPALRPFEIEEWMRETSQLQDDQVCTLGLFQEALSECKPKVPSEMKSEESDNAWWMSMPETYHPKPVEKRAKKTSPPPKPAAEADDDETETEDEFETHENFKLREARKEGNIPHPAQTSQSIPLRETVQAHQPSTDDSETEDDDLDAPPRSQNQPQSQERTHRSAARASSTRLPLSRSPTPETPATPPKRRAGFKIGGARTKKAEARDEEIIDAVEPAPSQSRTENSPQKPRKTFKIGGRNKSLTQDRDEQPPASASPNETVDMTTSTADGPAAAAVHESVSASRLSTLEVDHEETAEEKAERRRLELKRKNEGMVKKQAHKKKKRF